jgi:hypothetical protein
MLMCKAAHYHTACCSEARVQLSPPLAMIPHMPRLLQSKTPTGGRHGHKQARGALGVGRNVAQLVYNLLGQIT